ncbi:hypothetical protein [Streptomyces sp. NPDC055709]
MNRYEGTLAMKRTRRWLAVAVCTVATTASLGIAPAAHGAEDIGNDPHLTDYDRAVLGERGTLNGKPGAFPYNGPTNAWATAYCQEHGFGTGMNQCRILSFQEEKRVSWTPNYMRQVSEATPMLNCSSEPARIDLTWSHSNTATHTAGASISVATTINFKAAPFGVGVDGSVTTTVGANYSYAWGTVSTTGGTNAVSIPAGHIGWLDYADFHGTSHGIADVIIPDYGFFPREQDPFPSRDPYVYRVVTDITGDLPEPSDPQAVAAQGVTGLIGQSAPASDEVRRNFCAHDPGVVAVSTTPEHPTQSQRIA